MTQANIALLQLCSGEQIPQNLAQIEQQLKQLPPEVQLVMTPENALLFADAAAYRHHAEAHNDGPLQQAIRDMARRYNVWLLVGSMPMISREDPQRLTSSSLLFDNRGELHARYDKLHMFDVDINDSHVRYRESDVYQPGQHIAVVETPVGRLGMTICYDLRFPGLFQSLRAQGAELIAVPAAFTSVTGEAHWEILLRARAIETQCFILAPAQVGRHSESRRTWGHTMAVNGWGGIMAHNSDAVAALTLNVDVTSLDKLRQQMPVIHHNRFRPLLLDSTQQSTNS